MFGLKFKEPYRYKRHACTDNEGFYHITYQRRLDLKIELIFTALGCFFTCVMIDAIWNLNVDVKYYWLIVLCATIIRLCTMIQGGENHTE